MVPALVGRLTAQEWNEFSSAEGRFSILMPGKPTEGSLDQPTGSGNVTAHFLPHWAHQSTWRAAIMIFLRPNKMSKKFSKRRETARSRICTEHC